MKKLFTKDILCPYNEPSEAYLDTLYKGIMENWSEIPDKEIEDYLENCRR